MSTQTSVTACNGGDHHDGVVDGEDGSSKKRMKAGSVLQQVLSPETLEKESELKAYYSASKPYPHGYIENIFQPDFLFEVKEEIKSHSKVNFKESDLFRVYQSIDMANLQPDSDLAKSLPSLMTLREVLYSQEWTSFIERMAGLPPSTLNSQIDCACNCHAPGCHLLCHDDVIGTRKVSYIIYLTESDWKPEEGGSLELYGPQLDDESKSSPPVPLARVWPIFNSMAFFIVEPGVSFHAVQEVLGERPRLSLQGWYHASTAPENIHKATLQQLKARKAKSDETKNDNGDTANERSVLLEKAFDATETDFSAVDREYLSKYLQAVYLTEESMSEICTKFIEDSSVQLRNFFQEKWIPMLEPQKIEAVYDDDYYTSGCSAEWKLQGPAHKQRFLEYQQESSTKGDSQITGSLLHHLKTQVLESEPFARFLKRITSLDKPAGIRSGKIRRFRPGLDYTVAHYGLLVDKPVLDATICFVYDDNGDKDAWESGDVGGFECYIEADDDDAQKGPADEYNEDDDTELLSVSASNNTLSLVYRDPGTMRFVKYIGYSAPSSRYDISIEYEVPEDEKRGNLEDEDQDENCDGSIGPEVDEGEEEGDERVDEE